MTPTVCLVELVHRIVACGGGDAYFTQDEIAGWPLDAVKAMEAVGLLAQASHANSTECDGCEEACTVPVHVIPENPPSPGRAFIVCDRRDDIGRVVVAIERLARRKSSGSLLAQALCKLVLPELASPVDLGGNRWKLGNFHGLKLKSPLELSLSFPPVLTIAGHTVELCDVISVRKSALVVDVPALRKLVDNPTGGTTATNETAQQRADRIRQRITVLEGEGKKRSARKLVAREEGIDPSRIGQILRKHPEQKPSSNWFPDVAASKVPSPRKRNKS